MAYLFAARGRLAVSEEKIERAAAGKKLAGHAKIASKIKAGRLIVAEMLGFIASKLIKNF